MATYVEAFRLPINIEKKLIAKRMAENGNQYGYIDNVYPCGIFGPKELREVCFREVTIFYGGNGSGKSTLLNLIAAKLEINRVAPHSSGELFDAYARQCRYSMGCDDEGFKHRVPNGSRIITSDDVFDYMLAARTNNDDIREGIERGKDEYRAINSDRSGGQGIKNRLTGMENFEEFRANALARDKNVSRRKYLQEVVGREVRMGSNGETALSYFEAKLKNDTLYCLDEPENSMSPKMQIELMGMLQEMAKYCGCQLIIATHSPFLLSLDGALIYDLDASPVDIKNWWELENTRVYYDFFKQHEDLFSK